MKENMDWAQSSLHFRRMKLSTEQLKANTFEERLYEEEQS